MQPGVFPKTVRFPRSRLASTDGRIYIRLSAERQERRALPLLARGAALRFLLTRAYDWINTPADALVTRKDPQAFLHRLQYYQTHPDIFKA